MNAREIAGKLGRMRREALLRLPVDGSFQVWELNWLFRSEFLELELIEGFDDPRAGVEMKLYRLTPLGLEVRAILEESGK